MAPPKIPLIPPIGTLVVVLRTVPTRGALRKRTGRVQCAPYVEDVKAVINSIYIYTYFVCNIKIYEKNIEYINNFCRICTNAPYWYLLNSIDIIIIYVYKQKLIYLQSIWKIYIRHGLTRSNLYHKYNFCGCTIEPYLSIFSDIKGEHLKLIKCYALLAATQRSEFME